MIANKVIYSVMLMWTPVVECLKLNVEARCATACLQLIDKKWLAFRSNSLCVL